MKKRNWKNLFKMSHSRGLFLINYIFQRIFKINSACPCMVHFTSQMSSIEKVNIGKNVEKSFAISGNCYIQGYNGIDFGDDVLFGPGVKIISADHDVENLNLWKKERPITIGKKCWIGGGATILPGVRLGDNVIVGADSVVTKSFSSNVVIVGNPAKIVRNLKNKKRQNVKSRSRLS